MNCIKKYLETREGRYSFYFEDLRSGYSYGYNESVSMTAAGCMKLPIAISLIKAKEDKKVKVFFIEHTDGKDVYRTVLRTNNTEMSDIEYAVKTLVAGPTKYERSKGVYSEIPPTKVLFVRETADRVSVNLSDSFGNGGGADSLYKRMYQLIKTVNYNTSKPVYLLMNGQLVETIGGEGLMLKQPLNGSSLDD